MCIAHLFQYPVFIKVCDVHFTNTRNSKTVIAMKIALTAIFQKVPEGYIAFVEELPGANTQGSTLEEARANREEAVQLVLQANRELAEEELEGVEVIRESLALVA